MQWTRSSELIDERPGTCLFDVLFHGLYDKASNFTDLQKLLSDGDLILIHKDSKHLSVKTEKIARR